MKNIHWPAVDWTQYNTTLAVQFGCSHSTIYRHRKIHAPGSEHKRSRYDWSRIKDWNQRTDALARIVGCSEKRVTMYRHEQGIRCGPRKPGSGLHMKNPKHLANS
jgi:hypothetical protein